MHITMCRSSVASSIGFAPVYYRLDRYGEHKRGEPISTMAPEERMKQTEGSHKVVTAAAAGGKMAVLHSPVGVRSIVTSLVAFFILASSVVFLLLDREAGLQEEPAIRAGGGGGRRGVQLVSGALGVRQRVPAAVRRAQVRLHLPRGGL